MAIPLGVLLPAHSSNRPGQRRGNAPAIECNHPYWSCSRWGLPCHPCHQRCGALLPHPFILTAPKDGGLLSVALSLRSPSLAINQHRISVEPGLSSPTYQANPICSGDHPAICRPLSTIYRRLGQACCAIAAFQAKSGVILNQPNILSNKDEKTDRSYRRTFAFGLQPIW